MENIQVIDMRERIVDAAIFVAARLGFTKATTKEIADKAGCSEGIIYHYFQSKHDLFLAVISENAQEFLQQLHLELGEGYSPKDKLERLVDFHFRYFTGKVHIFQILFGKSGDSVVPFPYVLKTIILPYKKLIEEVINKGINSGQFERVNADVVASSILGMMQINIIRLYFGVNDSAINETKTVCKQIVFNALLKAKAEAQ